ncbi:MAG TPA: UDP-N-acetylmuramate dehydrogenase [Candidatus Acidoferrum sp.]|nr:UDP-N-acetylmuramate dehydrogenase [Candidatus Acidoferrum sp.]
MSGPLIAPRAFDAIALGTDIQRRIGVKTSRDEPLARFTTMRVGGPADLFAIAHNGFELRGLLKFARSRGLPHVLLGRGSNVVIADAGFRGLVIQDRAEGAEIREDRLVAEAGLPMARAATVTQEAGLSGLEFGLAIPGTVGGAVWANAGAHGSDVAGILESAAVLLADGTETRVPAADLGLGYRESRFKTRSSAEPPTATTDGATPPGHAEIVLGATFLLSRAEPALIKARLDDIRHWRQGHQPLGIPSAGSVFRNPPDGPSAGALIEGLGLKGTTEGGATVSPKHANFIVNDRRGTAADTRRLGERVRAIVRRETGVTLEFEIVFVGDWSDWRPEGPP